VRADADRRLVSAQDRTEPHARPVADLDITDQRGGGRDERALADARRLAVERDDARHRYSS